ncbi:GapA-binding peptide SR1P [Sinobaca sp. H24]|nr:GapA-binding peptide SR1P [Sinobaca sp. H24]
MGTIVCQVCNETIEHFEGEKVATLYSSCSSCGSQKKITANGKYNQVNRR